MAAFGICCTGFGRDSTAGSVVIIVVLVIFAEIARQLVIRLVIVECTDCERGDGGLESCRDGLLCVDGGRGNLGDVCLYG